MAEAHHGYIAISYNFASERFFAKWLRERFDAAGIPIWFLDNFDGEGVSRFLPESRRDKRYEKDWRLNRENWHATYLSQIQHALGILVLRSPNALASLWTPTRGMWREADAVDFIRCDNALRVKIVDNPTPFGAVDSEFTAVDLPELFIWARRVLSLPPVNRAFSTDRSTFNVKHSSPFVMKTKPTDWYELVRLDLYDVMWLCRRCGTESENYIYLEESAPVACPVCGFKGYEPDYTPGGFTLSPGAIKPSMLELAKLSVRVQKQVDLALKLQREGKQREAAGMNVEIENECRALRNLEPLAECLFSQAIFVHQAGDLDRAAELYGHVERILREIGDRPHLQQCLGNLGTILLDYGRLSAAIERFQEQERICREIRDHRSLEMCLENQALALEEWGDRWAASMLLEELVIICRENENAEGLERALNNRARLDAL